MAEHKFKFRLGVSAPQVVDADRYDVRGGFLTFAAKGKSVASFPSKQLRWIFRDDQAGFNTPPDEDLPGTA